MKAVAIIMTILGVNLIHEYHISVCDINFNTDKRVLEVTHRIFADDLENTLKSEGIAIDVLNSKDYKVNDGHFKKYLTKKIEVSTKDEKHAIQWLGHEVKSDQIVFYYEVKLSEIPDELRISNTVLMELFRDQKNLIHWKQKGKDKKSFILDKKKPFKIIDYSK